MKINCEDCKRIMIENKVLFINWIITAVFSIVSIIYRNDSSKITSINAIENLVILIISIPVIFISEYCCKKKVIEKDEKKENKNEKENKNDLSAIEDGKNLINLYNNREDIAETLKQLEENGNIDAPLVLRSLKQLKII